MLTVFARDGFGHSCPQHQSLLRTNIDYWIPKPGRKVQRDRETYDVFPCEDGLVVRVCEHDHVVAAASQIARVPNDSTVKPHPVTRASQSSLLAIASRSA